MALSPSEPSHPRIGLRIGIVGVCASGKSTLAKSLQALGFDARQVSQEHSYVPDLFRRFSHCDILIYLDVTFDTLRRRLDNPFWPAFLYEDQRKRVGHALDNCDLYIHTDSLRPEQVLACALAMLDARGVTPETPHPF
jgi:shikimate kinase